MKLIDVQTAARQLSVSVTTIHRMIRKKNCPLEGIRVNGAVKINAETVPLCLIPINKENQCQMNQMY